MPPLVYTLPELKALLHERTKSSTLEWLSLVERSHNFPRRLPGNGEPKWSKPAVDHWFNTWGSVPVPQPQKAAPTIESLRKLHDEQIRSRHRA